MFCQVDCLRGKKKKNKKLCMFFDIELRERGKLRKKIRKKRFFWFFYKFF